MPVTFQADALVDSLISRVANALNEADTNNDSKVDPNERTKLPPDVRGLAESTADRYLGGGPLPIASYLRAYGAYAREKVGAASRGGVVVDTDLPGSIYASVAAMRSTNTTGSLDNLYRSLSRGGFSDDDLMQFLTAAKRRGEVQQYAEQIVSAVMTPEMPADAASHTGDTFFEALAWYTDMTTSNRKDGRLTRSEVGRAIQNAAQKYLDLALGQPQEVNGRLQAWKNIQKLRLLEKEIDQREAAGQSPVYPYNPRDMMSIDATPWNRANTIDSAAEFNTRVIDGSYDKPVLVKFGLPYCMHCLLLEQLGSVPAVSEKYGDAMDVVKLWWNPKDPGMAEITRVAREQGVTSSPFFILYENGQPVRSGYAFPDEKGEGMQELLAGIVPEPR